MLREEHRLQREEQRLQREEQMRREAALTEALRQREEELQRLRLSSTSQLSPSYNIPPRETYTNAASVNSVVASVNSVVASTSSNIPPRETNSVVASVGGGDARASSNIPPR